jgi:hypothetical protein
VKQRFFKRGLLAIKPIIKRTMIQVSGLKK